MAKKIFYDPYARLIDIFNRRGVKYVVVGMSGINYYASAAKDTFVTQDFDIFVKPTISNLKKAIKIIQELGYNVSTNEQPISAVSVKDVLRQKKTVLATDPYGVTFEFILAVSGYTFAQMEADAVTFDVNKVPVKVARLSKLLMSKKIAGRDKDKFFLKRYEILLKQKPQKT